MFKTAIHPILKYVQNQLFLIVFLFLCCLSCTKGDISQTEVKTLYVNDHQVDCIGLYPKKCLLVKEKQEAEWSYFYEPISGFDYEVGFTYKLKVLVIHIANPPADASSYAYELINIISKK